MFQGTPIVRTGEGCVLATGQFWWQILPICKVTFTSVLPAGVSGKDVIVALNGLFNENEVLSHCVEFHGLEETIHGPSFNDRLTIANRSTEHEASQEDRSLQYCKVPW